MSEEIYPSNTDKALAEAQKASQPAQVQPAKPKENFGQIVLHGISFVETVIPTIKSIINVVGDIRSIIETGRPMDKPIAPIAQNNNRTSYNRCYGGAGVADPSWRRSTPEVRPTGAIDVYTEQDANMIKDRAYDVIDARGQLSVSDLYSITDDVTGSNLSRSLDYTYNNWGWYNINNMRVVPVGGERPWRIIMPNEVPLRR